MTTVSPARRRRERAMAAAIVLLLAAAIVALRIHNRRAERELARQTYVPKPTVMTPEVYLLQEYVRIDTSNPPGNESAGAQWLSAKLARGGVRAEIIESAPHRMSVYARIRGTKPGDGLLLLNHIDVVPAELKGWAKPPFSADIAANMIFGRGTADMKGIGICQLEAFLDVARAGRPPEHDVVFLAVADEEEGGTFGTRWLLEHRPDVYQGIKYVLTEGGVSELQKETLTYFGVEIGAKEITDLQLVAPTREQLQRARIALEPHFEPLDADRVLPGVRGFFVAVAPLRVEFESGLADIDRTIAEGKLWLLPSTYRNLLKNTIWAERVQRRHDGRFGMRVRMSNLPEVAPDPRVAWLAQMVAPFGVSIGEIEKKEGPIPISPADTTLFSMIATEVHREYRGVRVGPEVLSSSTSDARFLRPRGFVCYGLQPFPLDYFQTLGIHGLNERVRVDWFNQGVRLMRRVVYAYAFGATPDSADRRRPPK